MCCVFACVHVSALRLLINSSVIWTSYDWLNKLYSFYIATVVGIVSRRGFNIDVHHENHANQHKLAQCKPSIHFNCSLKWLYISSKIEHFSYKGGCGMACNGAFKRRASFGYI